MLTTSGNQAVQLQNTVRRGGENSPGNLNMELVFGTDNSCRIISTEGDPYNISGSGMYVEDADEWGGLPRDVIYLDYSYTDMANNETHQVKDTLVIRDRAVVFEEFTVEFNDQILITKKAVKYIIALFFRLSVLE